MSVCLCVCVCVSLHQLPDRDPDGEQAVPQRAFQIPGAHSEAGVHRGRGHAARGRGGDGWRGRPQVRAHRTHCLSHPTHSVSIYFSFYQTKSSDASSERGSETSADFWWSHNTFVCTVPFNYIQHSLEMQRSSFWSGCLCNCVKPLEEN